MGGIKKWKTKDGSIVSISSMGTPHIRNCITVLEKKQPKPKKHPSSLEDCLEIAYAIEQFYEERDMYIEAFEDELDFRGRMQLYSEANNV